MNYWPIQHYKSDIGLILTFRNKNNDKSLQPEKEYKDKPDQGLPKPASEPYDKLFPLEGVARTSDNYIELDPENTYATIDPDYVSRETKDGVRREDTTTVIHPDTPSGDAKYDSDKSIMNSVNKGKGHLSKDTKPNPPHLNLVQKTSYPYYNTDNQGFTSNEQTQPIHSEEETPSYYVLEPHNQ